MTTRPIASLLFIIGLSSTVAACDEKCEPSNPLCEVKSVVIVPSAVDFTALDDTVRLRVALLRGNGTEVDAPDGAFPSWSSSATDVAVIDEAGLLTSVGNGAATITASFMDSVRTIEVSVEQSATRLRVTTQPGHAQSGLLLSPQPVVRIADAVGNRIVGDNSTTVTASIASGGGTLGGTTSITAIDGVVAFSNLVITGADGPRTLRFTAPGLGEVVSSTLFIGEIIPPTPWFVEDFSAYVTSADMMATGGSRSWQSFYIEDQGSIALDKTSGVNIDGLNLSQSMRIDFPDMTSWTDDSRVQNGQQDRCDNYTIRPILVPNGTAFRSQRHLWFEFYIRFTPNWTTVVPDAWGCGGGEDHKTWLLLPNGGSGRWQIKIGRGDSPNGPAVFTGDPINGGDIVTNVLTWENADAPALARTYWDGEWHQMRAEVSLGTAGTPTGIFRFWLDGSLVNSYTDLTFPASFVGFSHMEMGANRNHGAGEPMGFQWGLIRIYDENPGW